MNTSDAKRVFLVRSNRAADAGRSIGLTCLISPQGTEPAEWSFLAGREVVIFTGRDDAGRLYAESVAGTLHKLDPAPTVRILDLPDVPQGGDLWHFVEKHDAVESETLAERINGLADQVPEYGVLPPPVSLRTLIAEFPRLRPPVIHGLVRQGETMNLIAQPKAGKSWLVYGLAVSVATGGDWLETFRCEPGRVLLIDGELHPETIAHRLMVVCEQMGVGADCFDSLDVSAMRGQGMDLFKLGRRLDEIEPGRYALIVLDAWYRFLPPGLSENDNAQVMSLYNKIDAYMSRLGAAWANVHHTSKGDQSGKGVTDVGSGAGSQSRAADTHLIIRPHEQEDVAVVDAVVRSWPPVEPLAIRWQYPLWTLATDADPSRLLRQARATQNDRKADQQAVVNLVHEQTEPRTKTFLRNLAGNRIPMGHGRFDRAWVSLVADGTLKSQEGRGAQNQRRELWTLREDTEV